MSSVTLCNLSTPTPSADKPQIIGFSPHLCRSGYKGAQHVLFLGKIYYIPSRVLPGGFVQAWLSWYGQLRFGGFVPLAARRYNHIAL